MMVHMSSIFYDEWAVVKCMILSTNENQIGCDFYSQGEYCVFFFCVPNGNGDLISEPQDVILGRLSS